MLDKNRGASGKMQANKLPVIDGGAQARLNAESEILSGSQFSGASDFD